MSEYEREMEQKSFSPEEFLERLAWPTVSNGDFNAEKLHSDFSEAISHLQSLLETQRCKGVDAEKTFLKEEQEMRNRLQKLLNKNQTATENLGDLEKKVHSVEIKVVRLGDQLESINLPRTRSNEAAKLMKHLADFLQPGSILLSDIFRNKDKLFEAAEMIQKLQQISQDLTSGGSNAKFAGAVEKINRKYDEVERSLLIEFFKAQRSNDKERMKQIAHILYDFKVYSQCVNGFIEQSQLGGFNTKDVFDEILPLCNANKSIIDQVFPNPEQVMRKFIIHIFNGRIQETLSSKLYEKDDQNKFLINLSSFYTKTLKVVKQLECFQLGPDNSFLEKILNQIFRPHLERYIYKECQCLKAKMTKILSTYYDRLNHQKGNKSFLQAVFGNKTLENLNFGQIENFGSETFLSEEVAINVLQESRIAYSRCLLLSKKEEISANALKIFDILTQCLMKEHVDYALELGLHGIPLPEYKNFPRIYFFDIVKSANAIVHLYDKEFINSLLPLITSTPEFSDCLDKKKAILEQLEFKIDEGIDRGLETISNWVKIVLQTEHNKRDFFKSDDPDESPDMISPVCLKIVSNINKQIHKIKDSIDGKNKEIVLTEFGTRFHRSVYEHIIQYQYSSTGALRVICDVGEYRKCMKELKIPVLTLIFDTLHALCNLLLCLPKDIDLYFNREELAILDPAIRMSFVHLRTDFKTLNLNMNKK